MKETGPRPVTAEDAAVLAQRAFEATLPGTQGTLGAGTLAWFAADAYAQLRGYGCARDLYVAEGVWHA